jgi:hypothetical protein
VRLGGQRLVEGILHVPVRSSASLPGMESMLLTMDRMTTQGRFSLLTMAWDKVDLPEPELPAMPMMLTSAQGGA